MCVQRASFKIKIKQTLSLSQLSARLLQIPPQMEGLKGKASNGLSLVPYRLTNKTSSLL